MSGTFKSALAIGIMVMVLVAPSLAGAADQARFRLDPDRFAISRSEDATLVALDERYVPGVERDDRPRKDRETLTGWYLGPMVQFLVLDTSIFDPMTSDRRIPGFSSDMFLLGVTGGVIRNNWRMGLWYLSGEQAQEDRKVFYDQTGIARDDDNRKASMDFMGFGLTLENNHELKTDNRETYPARIPYLRYGWLWGGMFGYGQLSLMAKGKDMSGPPGIADVDGTGANRYVTYPYESSTWTTDIPALIAYPYLGAWVSPYDWLWVEMDIGFLLIVLDTENADIENDLGEEMVDGQFNGGIQVGIKVLFGQNPNIHAEQPAPYVP